MNSNNFYNLLLKNFPHLPTATQSLFLQMAANFVLSTTQKELFVLKGYAGTGKTSLLSTLVTSLQSIGKNTVLLAPTGRAAKVVSNYSGKPAQTIHKKIYHTKNILGNIQLKLKTNKHQNTIFIVDEASMINHSTDIGMYTHGSLLNDLFHYVYSGINCKLILVGDSAQLLPVNEEICPALDINYLNLHFDLDTKHIELTEVLRQEHNSGILHNATLLREHLFDNNANHFQFELSNFKDIIRPEDGYETLDAIQEAYSQGGEETVFIVRSNKRANNYNLQIRTRVLSQEGELNTGDYIMIVKNNYFWLKDNPHAPIEFIANGDMMEVMRIYSYKELYGFHFAHIKARMIDYDEIPPFDVVVLLDTLTSENASLSFEDNQKLYNAIAEDYADEVAQYKILQKVKENPYFNALQIKFAYALTCHKSQGGQWNNVFIEQPYMPDGTLTPDIIRWLYTAITRAKNKVYLLGFDNQFFKT